MELLLPVLPAALNPSRRLLWTDEQRDHVRGRLTEWLLRGVKLYYLFCNGLCAALSGVKIWQYEAACVYTTRKPTFKAFSLSWSYVFFPATYLFYLPAFVALVISWVSALRYARACVHLSRPQLSGNPNNPSLLTEVLPRAITSFFCSLFLVIHLIAQTLLFSCIKSELPLTTEFGKCQNFGQTDFVLAVPLHVSAWVGLTCGLAFFYGILLRKRGLVAVAAVFLFFNLVLVQTEPLTEDWDRRRVIPLALCTITGTLHSFFSLRRKWIVLTLEEKGWRSFEVGLGGTVTGFLLGGVWLKIVEGGVGPGMISVGAGMMLVAIGRGRMAWEQRDNRLDLRELKPKIEAIEAERRRRAEEIGRS